MLKCTSTSNKTVAYDYISMLYYYSIIFLMREINLHFRHQLYYDITKLQFYFQIKKY